MSASSDLPPIVIPKKRKATDISALREEQDLLAESAKTARKKLRTQGSFDVQFWSAAADIETRMLEKTRISSVISLSEFCGEDSEWFKSEEARNLFAQMRAQKHRITSYTAQKQTLSFSRPRRGFRESFMQLFTSSRMGLGINTGMGRRDPSMQSHFRAQLLRDYESLDETGAYAWCPVLHQYVRKEYVTASHIFSYRHGQGVMDTIFGRRRPPELFSSNNGLILLKFIEDKFDTGVLAIVPNLPDRPSSSTLDAWVKKDVREYKVRIIDQTWTMLNNPVLASEGPRWRDLDNRPLAFIGKRRPAARYLYFHYCLQMLRRAWKEGAGQKVAFTLGEELGKPVWATPGRYIAKNMLRAFVEELGHDRQDLMRGARCAGGDRNTLLDVFANQIAEKAEEEVLEDSTEEEESDEECYNG